MPSIIWDFICIVVNVFIIKLEMNDVSDNLYTSNKAALVKAILMVSFCVGLLIMMGIITTAKICLL